ncbi:sigma-70 family RNA polymerase sigma factor [Flavobacterium jejuense]|uniref:Sigma-70 family RNA polymerase sigma factor n=1 Tax=Flavobacterium jejuense TaxID=1544455 RepID=A0ABX0IR02_9FLAO|nr:sigma-70 family RNA polymerase sigma factor [Flavobacterium jejuense]NHN24270.1 sigma-70 family RNA polymerase sigma factor [Flavobacterium jejuense]
MNKNNIVERIKQNDTATIKKIYLDNKLSFFKLANRYSIPNEVALDIYQDSIVALVENARKNSIDDLKSSINTYFIGIGKFMIFNYLKTKKTVDLSEFENTVITESYTTEDNTLNEREIALKKAYENLGEQCQKILSLFYFENKKLEEIQTILNYENKDVLKSQKSRCISHLKKSLNLKK